AVQKPHWTAPRSANACCTASRRPSRSSPSTVSTSRPSASIARYVHALTAAPSTSTVQAPQTWLSQERLAPLSPRRSRNTSSSSASAGSVNAAGRPFTWRVTSNEDGMRIPGIGPTALGARDHRGQYAPREHPRELPLVVDATVKIGDGVHGLGGQHTDIV